MALFLCSPSKQPQAQAAKEILVPKIRRSDALPACFSAVRNKHACFSEGCFAAASEQAEPERAKACEEIDSVARELQFQHLSENDECESDFEEEGDIGCEDSSCAYWETQCGPSGRIGGSGSRRSVYSTRHIRIIASRKG
jgi:hypothetical protein